MTEPASTPEPASTSEPAAASTPEPAELPTSAAASPSEGTPTHEAGSTSESPTQEEAQPIPEPRPRAAATWTPPLTFSDKFSHYSRKLIRFTLVAVGLSLLVTFVLWVIPTVLVVNSEAYGLAVAKIEKHRGVRSFLGAPVTCERVPIRYALTEDGGRLAFVVTGSYGRGLVDVEVYAGRVVRVYPQYAVDWTRPLSAQLPRLPAD